MTTVKQAKETEIWIEKNGFPEETNLYEWVMNFESENKLYSQYREDVELNEETGNYEDNGKWVIIFKKVNQREQKLTEYFDTEEEADDFIFQRTFEYEFNNSCENTSYFNSEDECKDDIIEQMAGNFYIAKNVAENIYRKSLIVFEERNLRNAIHRAKINKEYEERKAFLSTAVPAEAASLTIDAEFKEDVKAAMLLKGMEKNNKCSSALKGLLQRNGRDKIESDFWQVFRILKATN